MDGFALRNQDTDLPQLCDDLFGLVTLSRHGSDPPRSHKTYFKVDQFNGGGSLSDGAGEESHPAAAPRAPYQQTLVASDESDLQVRG
jgi:hypothetical protein